MTKVKTTIAYIILIIASFLSAFPLYYMICGATNSSIDIVRGKLFPGIYLMENYQSLIANQNLGRAMFNSFRNAIVITVIALLICSIAGYGFEIYHDKGKDLLMNILLLAMMLPFVAIMIPLFKMFSSWKLVNTWIALALPSLSTPFLIMMFRQAARSFPHDIIQAARLEGLSEIRIFFTMFLPIMKSTYGAAMTVTFMNAWNNYLWPTIILQDSNQITMPMLVANLKSGYSVDYGMLMLGHGSLKLVNTSVFDGSYIQVGSKVFAQITGEMTIEIPEGTYTAAVANNGYGGSTEITITRGQETVLDLETLKGEGPKYGSILFAVNVEGAWLQVDGQLVDYSQPVELQYGVHTLTVTADGYDTYSKKLFVNSPEATIAIGMTGESGSSSTTTGSETQSSEADSSTSTGESADGKSCGKSGRKPLGQQFLGFIFKFVFYIDGNSGHDE